MSCKSCEETKQLLMLNTARLVNNQDLLLQCLQDILGTQPNVEITGYITDCLSKLVLAEPTLED